MPPGRPLLPCLEDRAKALFVSRYVIGKSPTFPFLKSFWHARAHHIHLAVGVRAVSLAYLSVELRSSEILERARHRYGSTLLLVNAALQCPQTAKDNATLLAVLLLDLFEKLTQQLTSDSSANTSRHIDGALALIKLAGVSQFNDAIRMQMFHHLSIKILLNCLEREVEVPSDLLSLYRFIDMRAPEWQIEDSIIRFIALRAGVRKGEVPEAEMIAESKKLDEVLARM